MPSASKAREPDAFRDCSIRLLGSASATSSSRVGFKPRDRSRRYAFMGSVKDRDASLAGMTSQEDRPPKRGVVHDV
jgi:hypothetical protein